MNATCSWYNVFIFLVLVHFSLSAKPKGFQKQLNRHGARLKAIEAKQDVDQDKFSEYAERISMLESLIEGIVNDTKSTSVSLLENGGSKQEVSSDIASVCSNICPGDDIRIILKAFHQEKVLNTQLRKEISDLKDSARDVNREIKLAVDDISGLKNMVKDVNEDVTQAVDEISDLKAVVSEMNTDITHAIRNATEIVEEQCKQSDQQILAEVKTDMESFNSSIVYLTQKSKEFDENTIMALNMSETVSNELHIITARPPSCKEIFDDNRRENGVYTVYPAEQGAPVRVYCDMETDGGGWTVFQRRQDGSIDFYRNWTSYELGFGKLEGEFWLGNKHISEMTKNCCYELRIDMDDFEGNKGYAKYGTFQVLSQAENYALVVGNYSGNEGDSLRYHSGMAFTTKDRDNDALSTNCAEIHKGAWWYKSCFNSHLNGRYLHGYKASSSVGINWLHWKSTNTYSLKMTEMKFRKI